MRQYILGVVFIILCACLWAGSSVLIQFIYDDLSFDSPFLLTYLATSLLALHLPYWYLKEWWRSRKAEASGESAHGLVSETVTNPLSLSHSTFKQEPAQQPPPRTEHRDALAVAMIIAPLWFGANCLYNYSLLWTTVSSSTIISNLSAAFTLSFSVWLGVESFSKITLVGVVLCFLGALCTTFADERSNDDHSNANQGLWGDVLAVGGAAGYGLYTSVLRYLVPEDSESLSSSAPQETEGTAHARVDADRTKSISNATPHKEISMHLLLGYIGLLNAVLFLVPLMIMYALSAGGVASVSGVSVGAVLGNGVADTVLADYFWARAVLLTSPTIATLGMSVTIPLALLTDLFVDGIVPSALDCGGAILVIAGFMLVHCTEEQIKGVLRRVCAPSENRRDRDRESVLSAGL